MWLAPPSLRYFQPAVHFCNIGMDGIFLWGPLDTPIRCHLDSVGIIFGSDAYHLQVFHFLQAQARSAPHQLHSTDRFMN